ncbi:hypothetical protein MKW94_014104 [Papaver nudicaule]|uniref:Alpha-SNAP n=1 Tax=Papaver nudicaule TaxID=74823 RepID=A0AA42AQV2_PAPNU|nr:hypothetical protein [Papaver nudicaule]
MLYESEQDFEKSIVYLERAADLFQREEDSSTLVNRCKQKIAQCCAQLEQFSNTVPQVYHSKYDVKGYLLTAGLCQLCEADDVDVAISNALERYEDLAASVDRVDVQRFTNVVKQFRRFTNWYVS